MLMLIDIFAGVDRDTASLKGSMYFARTPEPGEHIEVDGGLLAVTHAWHRPDNNYRGAKFAVLVDERIDRVGKCLPANCNWETVA